MTAEEIDKTPPPFPIPNPTYIYKGHSCPTPEKAAKVTTEAFKLNGYIYLTIPQAKGAWLIAAVPNPEAFKHKQERRVELGLAELNEDEAIKTAENQFSNLDRDKKMTVEIAMTRLYDNGFKLCKQVDREVKPQ